MKILFVLLALTLSLFAGESEQVVNWDYPQEDWGEIVGFKVYYGDQSGDYHTVIDVGMTFTARLTGLNTGETYHSIVTSYNSYGAESLASNEISFVGSDPVLYLSLSPKIVEFKVVRAHKFKVGEPHVIFNIVSKKNNDQTYFIGEALRIEVSNDLRNWSLLKNIIYSGQPTVITDLGIKKTNRRFYRAIHLK